MKMVCTHLMERKGYRSALKGHTQANQLHIMMSKQVKDDRYSMFIVLNYFHNKEKSIICM